MKKRLLASLLSLCLLLGLLPIATALAVDGDDTGTIISASTASELYAALGAINASENGMFTISLEDDIYTRDADEPANGELSVTENKTVTLLGNGHTLYVGDVGNNKFLIRVAGGTLNMGLPGGTDQLTILGDAQYGTLRAETLIDISAGEVNMYDGVHLSNRHTTGKPGGVVCVYGGTFNMYGGEMTNSCSMVLGLGGAVGVVDGTFNMYGGHIADNSVTAASDSTKWGGAIYMEPEPDATATPVVNIEGGVIENNHSNYGGAVCSVGGTFKMSGGTISGNTAEKSGGALYLKNTLVDISGGTIAGNSAKTEGGGIYINNSAAGSVIADITVSGNTAGAFGGGIALFYADGIMVRNCDIDENNGPYGGGIANYGSDNVKLASNTITENEATDGGGIYIQDGAGNVVTGGTISGNTATNGGGFELFESSAASDALLTGGVVISGNTASSYGGGVCFNNFGLKASGAVTVQDNTLSDGTAQNLYLMYDNSSGTPMYQLLTVTGPLTGSKIGVTMQVPPGTFTTGYNENNSGVMPSTYFTSDDPEYVVDYDAQLEAQLTKPVGTVALTAQDMTAYTGGDSLDGDSFPTVRFRVEATEELNLADISFELDGETYHLPDGTQNGDIVILPWMEESFVLQQSAALPEADEDTAAEHDAIAGIYEISVDVDAVSAHNQEGRYVKVAYQSGELIVRNVSQPNQVLNGTLDIAQPVVSDPSAVNTEDGIGIAVIEEGVHYFTNGKEELGVLGAGESQGAQISLLFDDILPGEQGEDTAQLLVERAEEAGYSLSNGNFQFKYLDLVNENDGNAWVSTEDGSKITIYWPCPDGISTSGYTFQVLHFKGLHREYRGDIAEQISNSSVERIGTRIVGNNIVFELEGNQAGGSFSPFALVWSKNSSGGGTIRYTITASAGEGGSISPSGTVRVARGSDRSFTISAEDGYEISDVFVDSESIGAVSSYTFENVRADHTIEAVFSESQPVVNPDDPDPEEPDTPDNPDIPVNPDDPDTPDNPDNPTEPDEPEVPDEPDTPDEPDEPKLPQTGQLWLPVWLLALAGAALVLTGIWSKTRYRGKHER